MKKPSPIDTGELTLLSVSPLEEDHRSLQAIIGHSTWMLFKADTLPSALTLLEQHEISIVLCERDLLPGTWIDLLEHIHNLPQFPSLIVTSRLADERLWSEVLNRSGWDLLAKPFEPREVIRSVKSAWHHWHDHVQKPAQVMKAAS